MSFQKAGEELVKGQIVTMKLKKKMIFEEKFISRFATVVVLLEKGICRVLLGKVPSMLI